MKTILVLAVVMMAAGSLARATPLESSTFTEVINDVNTLPSTGTTVTPAKVNDVLKAPDRVRTGPDSRAELTAPDQTITRVGANTIFSFAGRDRTLNLEQGNLLFHAPKGQGGGVIKSGGAAAAVLGTTLIVSATAEGGFKVILLEGKGMVTLPNGRSAALKAGQMVYVKPGGTTFSAVLNINLAKLVAGSQLVNGFPDPLSSLGLIQQAIQHQEAQIASGQASDTGVSADNYLQLPAAGNGLNGMDHGTYQTVVHPQFPPGGGGNLTTGFQTGPITFGGGPGNTVVTGGSGPSGAP